MSLKQSSISTLLVVITLAAASTVLAQTESAIAVARSDMQADRQAIIAANLPMTEAEAAVFWPLYREYHAEIAKVGDRTVQLITDYAKAYVDESLTDTQAMDLTTELLKQQKTMIELKQKYVERFGKVLPGKTTARFYQIENKLDAVVMVGIADQIPLVE